MKLNKLALACAAALTLPAIAHANAPAGPWDTAGAVKVYMSGASAPDNFLNAIATSMFDAGYITYSDDGALPGAGFTAFLGYTNAAFTSGANNMPIHTKVLLIKRSKGGSVWGVNPLARSEAIATLNVGGVVGDLSHPGPCTAATGSQYKCPVIGLDPAVGVTPTGNEMVPDFGISDVAPFMFKSPMNVEAGATQLSVSEAGYLSTFPVQAVGMGVVTTAEIPDTAYISQADYAAMLSGNIKDWSKLNLAPAGATASGATEPHPVVVCRRVPGSGTQASYNWAFNNFPCTGNSATSGVDGVTTPKRMSDSTSYGNIYLGLGDGSSAADAIGVDVTAGYTVIENSGSGDVRKCLNAAQNGGVYSFKDENNLYHYVDFGAGHYGAIGVLSLDSQAKTSTDLAKGEGAETYWFFRPVDGAGVFHNATQTCTSGAVAATGVCPSKQNLLKGRYAFAVESTSQYRNAASGNALDTTKKPFVDELIKRAGATAYQKNWTTALPLVTNGLTPTFDVAHDVSNNVAVGSHKGNMCQQFERKFGG
ncbi:hypothetical protein SCT_0107 [Sulfuricella sp. T08]|uniref:substrate-binding domain-containing protein n=1 Tax=Sulfuricella sp. T08 TaxID=1632857 RepID=UPI00061799FB|nr:substrate-binding domain-containing protein [Sulfuricella sp. T08]GAO34727.1 hypothetical protein SCT_0107 [Sulfuricella sp. T08]